ncbi:MAG: hypothetical protein HY069_03535 [Chlamydiia bacterium]|nr:hypothetical protein [Chlamydiia bacterium]
MNKHPSRELPVRSRLEMIEDIAEVVRSLHQGELARHLLDDLKTRALFFEAEIQQDVLMFCEQVEFQFTYDPWHRVTLEIQRAADKLIEDLGFTNEKK